MKRVESILAGGKAASSLFGVAMLGFVGAALAVPQQVATARQANPEIISVEKIWDAAPQNAFTDLVRFRGDWYCALREGDSVGNHPTGRARVLRSAEGEDWESVALIEWSGGGDIRDVKLSVTAGGSLMLNSAIYFTAAVDGIERQSVSWLSSNGEDWSSAYACPSGIDTWRWSVTWHNGMGYSVGYTGKDATGTLYRTRDGKQWEMLVEDYFPEGSGNETALVFDPDDTGYCLLRGGPGDNAHLGTAKPPYRDWTWADLGAYVGGPEMIRLPDGRYLGAGRFSDGRARTSIAWINPEEGTMREVLELPSGGHNSYPGMIWHDGILWMSYYSSHEGKASVYLAKIRVPGAE